MSREPTSPLSDLPPSLQRQMREMPYLMLRVVLSEEAVRFLRRAPSVPPSEWSPKMEARRREVLDALDRIERRIAVEVELQAAARGDDRIDVDALHAALAEWALEEEDAAGA